MSLVQIPQLQLHAQDTLLILCFVLFLYILSLYQILWF